MLGEEKLEDKHHPSDIWDRTFINKDEGVQPKKMLFGVGFILSL